MVLNAVLSFVVWEISNLLKPSSKSVGKTYKTLVNRFKGEKWLSPKNLSLDFSDTRFV